MLIAMWGCSGGGETTPTSSLPEYQGVVAISRWDDGTPMFDGTVVAGSSQSDPDAAGQSYFLDLFPGRSPVTVRRADALVTTGVPDVVPDMISATVLDVKPLPAGESVDPTAGFTHAADGYSLEIPPSIVALDGVALTTPYDLVAFRVREADRPYLPGDQMGIRNDVEVAPIRLVEIVQQRGLAGEDDLTFTDGAQATVTLDLPADSPILAADPTTVRFYGWSTGRGYWSHGGVAAVDAGARTVSFESGGFGWFGIALDGTERPCVNGRAVAGDGTPVGGAEVRAFQEGLMGVDRVTAAADGSFCLPLDDGATSSFRVVGFDNTRTRLFTGSGIASGPIGDIVLDTWEDADLDRAFDGPGGDCDDSDPNVGPSVGLADGSWCGEPL